MRFRSTNKKPASGRLDMTPLIDCIFQLLLFFLIASRFEEEARAGKEGELPAVLPEAASAMPIITRPREVIINVDREGRFIVSQDVYNQSGLGAMLRQAVANNPGRQTVIIRGDEQADWKHIAFVMGLCNQASITDYRVAVIPADPVPGVP